jgi:hypothetical protein
MTVAALDEVGLLPVEAWQDWNCSLESFNQPVDSRIKLEM